MFSRKLKEKETQHLRKLTEAYSDFKAKKEQELATKMAQFSSLFTSIEQIFGDLKVFINNNYIYFFINSFNFFLFKIVILKQNPHDHSKCDEMLARIRRDMRQAMLNQLSSVKDKVYSLQQESLDRLQSQTLKQQQLQGNMDLLRCENDQLKQQIVILQRDQQALNVSARTCEELSRANQNLVTVNL
jgi:hypothetical protein